MAEAETKSLVVTYEELEALLKERLEKLAPTATTGPRHLTWAMTPKGLRVDITPIGRGGHER